MKKSIVSVVCMFAIVLFGLTSNAQPHHRGADFSPEKRTEKFTAMMTEKLELTEAQSKRVYEVHLVFAQQMKSNFEANRENREAMHEGAKALHEQQDVEFKKILSEEQYAMWVEHRAHFGRRGRHHGTHHRPPHHGPHHFAKGPHKMPRHKAMLLKQLSEEDRKSLKQELDAYHKTNVHPMIKAQRLKLDKALNSVDQRKVAQLRTELQQLRPQFEAFKESKKEAFMSGEKPSEELREQIRAISQQKRAIGEQAKPIVEKYDTEITTLLEELKEQHHQWRNDKEAIMKKYFDKAGIEMPAKGEHPPHKGAWDKKGKEGCCEGGEMPEGCCKDGKMPEGCDGQKRPPMPPRHRKGGAKKIHFLLMDPDAKAPFELTNEMDMPVEDGVEMTNVFPNPVATTQYQTIEYKVRKEGNVKIDILTRDGGFVKTVLNETKSAGTYSLQVDISDLKDEIYLYTITDRKGKTKTERFLIQRD